MISWKSRSTAFVIILAIIAISFSPLLTPTKKAQALFNCVASNGVIAGHAATTGGEAAAMALIAVPTYSGVAWPTDIGAIAGATWSQNLKQNCLDGIGWMLAKILVAYITQSIVQWINSGFQGSPTFISDPQGFFLKIADEQFVNFMKEVFPETGGIADLICSPFSLDIKLKLILKFNYNYKRSTVPAGCRLTDIANNITGAVNGVRKSIDQQYNEFVGGNFQEGGWDRWFEVTQNSANNKYGAEINADLALQASIQDAQGREQKILDFGDGFKSLTSGSSNITSMFNQIITPGKTVQESLSKSLGTGVDQLNIADSIDEIVGALIGQLLKQALQGGVSNLSEPDSNNGGKSYLDRIGTETDYLNSSTTAEQGTIPTTPAPVDIGPIPNPGTTQSQNIALNKPATQSSNYKGTTVAKNAVDGNNMTNTYSDDYFSVTNQELNAWWQVDLESVQDIATIKIHPRLNATNPLTDFYVFVSDEPISGSLSEILANTKVKSYHQGAIANPPLVVTVGRTGRYVRIERAETDPRYLELSEVEVWSKPADVPTPIPGGPIVIQPPSAGDPNLGAVEGTIRYIEDYVQTSGNTKRLVISGVTGSASGYITYKTRSGSPIVLGNGPGANDGLVVSNSRYVKVQDVIVENQFGGVARKAARGAEDATMYPSFAAARVERSNHIIFQDVSARNNFGTGIGVLGSSYVTIRGTASGKCSAYNNGLDGIGGSASNINMAVSDTHHVLVQNCDSYSNNSKWKYNAGWAGGGGKWVTTDSITIDGGRRWANVGPGLWFDYKNSNETVKNVEIFGNVGSPGSSWAGAGIAFEISPGPNLVTNNYIHDNTGDGTAIWESTGVTIRNNKFKNDTAGWRECGASCGRAGLQTKNNQVLDNQFCNGQVNTPPANRNNVVSGNTNSCAGM